MRKILSIIFSVFILFGTMSVSASAIGMLNDIDGHWAEESIKRAIDKGIINGYPDGSFKPDNSVSRAELAKILTIAFDLNSAAKLPEEFEDVENNQWYYSYVQKAAYYIPKYRLPVAYPSMQPYLSTPGKFLPNSEAVRMHVAEALVEITIDKKELQIELPSVEVMQMEVNEKFKDGYELFVAHDGLPAGNAERMIKYTWLANNMGIMQGEPDGYFYPYRHMTRAELVTAVDRMMK